MSTILFAPLFDAVYGSMYLSVVLSSTFYGVTLMQTFFYYVHYPDDSLRMKTFVAVLWVFDTVHEALAISGVYKYIMAGLSDPLSILNPVPDIILLPMTLISLCTQAYFVYRIYVFSGKNLVAPLLWLIQAIYQIVVAILYVAKSTYSANGVHVVGYIVLSDKFFTGLVAISLATMAVVDVLIAIAMTFLLIRKRNAAGFANTAHILQRLTMFAVNTGIWTAIFAVLSFILLRALPETAYYAVCATPLGSLYCNTLLANLNARTYIQNGTSAHNAGPGLVMMSSPPGSSHSLKADNQSGDVVLIYPRRNSVERLETTQGATFMDLGD